DGVDGGAGSEVAEHDEVLVAQVDRGQGERHVRVGRREVRRGRLVLRVRVAPNRAGARQRGLLELAPAAARVPAEALSSWEEHGAAGGAAGAEQVRLVVGGEPAFDGGHLGRWHASSAVADGPSGYRGGGCHDLL